MASNKLLKSYLRKSRASLEAQRASMEAQALEELRKDLAEGELSDVAMAVDDQADTEAQHAAQLIEAVADARQVHDDLVQTREVEEQVQDVRDTADIVNENGGFSTESLKYMALALRGAMRSWDASLPLPFQMPSMEALVDGKVVISLESIDELLTEISEVKGAIEAGSVDALLRIFEALKCSMPEVKDRMLAMKESLNAVTYDETKEINIDDEIFKSLNVNGALPTGFKNYFESYAEFANRLLSQFTENALVSADKAGEIGDRMASLNGASCPIEALCGALDDVGDPREGIDADQLCFNLPGAGPLFGNPRDVEEDDEDSSEPEAVDESTVTGNSDAAAVGAAAQAAAELQLTDPVNPSTGAVVPGNESQDEEDPGLMELQSCLEKFVSQQVPLDPLAWSDRQEAPEGNVSFRVLSKETIHSVLCELIKSFEIVDIKSYGEAHRQVWVKARSANGTYQAGLSKLTAVQAAKLRPLDQAMAEYFDTVYELATWPVVHLLTNMVLSANAFLLLAERSISGESAPEKSVPEDDEIDANGDVPVTSGGDGSSDDAIAAADAQANNDMLADPAADAALQGDQGASAALGT